MVLGWRSGSVCQVIVFVVKCNQRQACSIPNASDGVFLVFGWVISILCDSLARTFMLLVHKEVFAQGILVVLKVGADTVTSHLNNIGWL